MKDFIKIFERDPFGDKVVDVIKEEWKESKHQEFQKEVRKFYSKRSKGTLTESDVMSMHSKSIFNKSNTSSFRYSM